MNEALEISFVELVNILAVAQSLLLGSFLVVRSNATKPTLFLGLLVLTLGLELVPTLIYKLDIFPGRPYLRFMPIYFYFLSAPLLYVYSRELTKPLHRTVRNRLLIPGLIEFLILSGILLVTGLGAVSLDNKATLYEFVSLYFLVGLVFSVAFIVITIFSIRSHRRNLPNYFSNGAKRELRWLEFLCYGILLLLFGWICSEPLATVFPPQHVEAVLSMFNVLIILWTVFQGLLQQSISLTPEHYLMQGKTQLSVPRTEDVDAPIFEDVQAYMHSAKPFLNTDLQLFDLARSLEISPRKLSILISSYGNTNFRGFVNSFRVQEAQRLLREGSAKQFTILGIAHESGFNSKATFYAVFKEFSGCSPGEYKSALSPLKEDEGLSS